MKFNDPRLPARFWAKVRVVPLTGCWRWIASLNVPNGYGQFVLDGARRLAHRVAYEALIGPIPERLQLDHLCAFRQCCNPAHLEVVTSEENTRRGLSSLRGTAVSRRNARKTECPNGHPYSGDNLLVWTRKNRAGQEKTYRTCRECGRNHARAYQRRQRDES